jgi:phosphoglucomutase
MPALTNPKHEAFAQALAKGVKQEKAYSDLGYAANKGHAARLAGKGNVKARVAELQAQSAQKTVKAVSFNAVDMFQRLIKTCEAAEAAGDHKAAIDGQKFVLRCFGYEDSPTLTHEHITGQKLPEKHQEGQEQDPATIMAQAMTSAFPEALKRIKRDRAMN